MPLALRYMRWLKLGIPLWSIGYFLGMFVRNDGSPTLVGVATICGGVFNIFGDFFLTLSCDMGIEGAAIATVVGQTLVCLIQLSHFFSKKNTIAFVKIDFFFRRSRAIMSIGFLSFICSAGMGFIVILFNNQIMWYFGSNELAVYGVAGNLFTLVQTFSYGIGSASQPIVAENMGAGNLERVRETKNLGSLAAVTILFPTQITRLYMSASKDVLIIAPGILQRYFICLLFAPFNVYATYYLQAVQRVKESVCVSLLRGFLLSEVFLYLFPLLMGGGAIWYVMLGAEMAAALTVAYLLKNNSKTGGKST